MRRTSKKVKHKVWIRALIVLATLVAISLGVVAAIFHLGEGSATVEFIRGDWRIFLGGTCGFFTVIFAVLLRAYKQLLILLGAQLILFLCYLAVPEHPPPLLNMIGKNGWLVMLFVLIVGGYIYFAFWFITKRKLSDFFEKDA